MLWVARDSDTYYQQCFFDKKFGSFFRINQIVLKAGDENDRTDLFQKKNLEIIYNLQSKIERQTFQFLNKTYSIKVIDLLQIKIV
jgi:hypothetical protein